MHKLYESLSKPFTIADGRNTLKLKNLMVEQKEKKVEDSLRKKSKFKSFYERVNTEESPKLPTLS